MSIEALPLRSDLLETQIGSVALAKREELSARLTIAKAVEEFCAARDEGRLCPPDAYDILDYNGLL